MSTEAERTSSVPETIATYLRLRGLAPTARVARRRRRRTDDENEPFTAGRDPKGVADILTDLTREAGWERVFFAALSQPAQGLPPSWQDPNARRGARCEKRQVPDARKGRAQDATRLLVAKLSVFQFC